jgi:hypothetical protein
MLGGSDTQIVAVRKGVVDGVYVLRHLDWPSGLFGTCKGMVC